MAYFRGFSEKNGNTKAQQVLRGTDFSAIKGAAGNVTGVYPFGDILGRPLTLFVYIGITYLMRKRAFPTLGILETSSTNPQLIVKVSNSNTMILL